MERTFQDIEAAAATLEAIIKEKPFEMSEDVKRHVVEELKKAISPERVRDEFHIRSYYNYYGYHPMGRITGFKLPEIVVYPKSTEDVRQVMLIASKYKVPVYAVTGQSMTIIIGQGGIVLDLTSMNKIHKIDLEHCYAVVEPGVTLGQLKDAIGPNYLIPKGSYPTSYSVLSPYLGNFAQHSFMNRMMHPIIGFEIVMPDGSVLYTGSMLFGELTDHWSDFAYSFSMLKDLFLPTRGNTGIVTKAAVRLWPKLDKSAIFIFGFNNFAYAYRFSHTIAKSPMVDQTMVYPWVSVGFFGGGSLLYGLDWFECRANYDQDNPRRDLFPYAYNVFIQTRGHSEEIDAILKVSQRIATQFNGRYIPEDDLFKWPALGGWYIWLLMSYLQMSPEEVAEYIERMPPSVRDEYRREPGHPWDEFYARSEIVAGPVDEIIRLYDGLKKKLKELGWPNFGFYTRMIHYGQTPWFRFFPFIDAPTPEDEKKAVNILDGVLNWVFNNYRVYPGGLHLFSANDPNNPLEVTGRAKPVRRLLRAVQREFDPENILYPVAKKYTVML
ncbi:MAG: FAD-binding oxidoreductase [Candidatus Bathyarchaeia archaeon]